VHESAVNATRASRVGRRTTLAALASLKLSLAAIAALAVAVAWSFDQGTPATWTLAVPLALIALNIGAAIVVRTAFRAQPALLVFHVCLIVLVLLIAASRLTYLRGRVELAQGEVFAGELVEHEAGPLHPWGLARARFSHDGFDIDYEAGRRRGQTRNRVRWQDDDGRAREATIGDQVPLVLAGYRFYTSPNKGFAVRLAWRRPGQDPVHAVLNLPPYPVYERLQWVEWILPGTSERVSVELEVDAALIDPARAASFRLPSEPVVRVGAGADGTRLRAGERAELARGRLEFEGLGTWMGYTVHYDPFTPWLLATCVLATGALGVHLWRKFAAQPWNP